MTLITEKGLFTNILGSLTDLTAPAVAARYAPAFGRDEEVEAVCSAVLQNQTVVLRGPSGVGKTAIWVEVARRLHAADPAYVRVYAASVAQLQNGCIYMGHWEQKLAELDSEIAAFTARGIHCLLLVTDFGNLFRVSRTSRAEQKVIADDVLGYVESGHLRVAGELTPDLFRPGLGDDQRWLGRIHLVDVPPLTAGDLLACLRRALAWKAQRAGGVYGGHLPPAWRRGADAPRTAAEEALIRAVLLLSLIHI